MRKSIVRSWILSLGEPMMFPRNVNSQHLKIGAEYSPFGILCELYRRYQAKGEWVGYIHGPQEFMSCSMVPPTAVLQWAELDEDDVKSLKNKNHLEVIEWLQKKQKKQLELFQPVKDQVLLQML